MVYDEYKIGMDCTYRGAPAYWTSGEPEIRGKYEIFLTWADSGEDACICMLWVR